MCKHVAAVLYGIGARLDQDPGLFFRLEKGKGQRPGLRNRQRDKEGSIEPV